MGLWAAKPLCKSLAPAMAYGRVAARIAGIVLFSISLYAADTALDRYVKAPDSHFKYELTKTIPGQGYTAYVLDMTSQQYLTEAEVNHPIWRHWLTVVKPAKVTSNVGLLFIRGGS